jgi:hypothetical protein
MRAAHAARGESPHDAWVFLRGTPSHQRDSKVWRSGKIPQRFWDESVAAVPEIYDLVQLEAPSWGGLRLRAPTLLQPGEPWREVRLWVESAADALPLTTEALVEWLIDAVATPGVTNGFVHVDGVADPYGDLVVEQSRFPDAGLAGRVEGYYWCLALGEPQLAMLGGEDAVRTAGLCEELRGLDVGGRDGLLCRLTTDPAGLTEDRVRAWRDLLEPLLRPGIPGRLDDLAPGGPLARPLWLYEGPPAPAEAPSVLVHGADLPPTTMEVVAPEGPADALACVLTVEGDRERDVAAAVEGAVGAWCRALGAGVLATVDAAVEVHQSAVTVDGDVLRWRLDSAAPLEPAAVRLLVASLQVLHDQLGWPHGQVAPGPALVRLELQAV